MKAAGNILLNPHTLNFTYAFNSFNLVQLSLLLPKGWLDTYGGISLNGIFSTNGYTVEALLYNLTNESEFIIKNAKINNFSIDTLIEKVNTKNYIVDYLKDDLAIAIFQGKTEIGNLHGNLYLKNGIVTLRIYYLIQNILVEPLLLLLIYIYIYIYNFGLTLTSIFSFYINNDYLSNLTNNKKNSLVNIQVNAKGDIFTSIKTVDDIELKKFFNNKKNS